MGLKISPFLSDFLSVFFLAEPESEKWTTTTSSIAHFSEKEVGTATSKTSQTLFCLFDFFLSYLPFLSFRCLFLFIVRFFFGLASFLFSFAKNWTCTPAPPMQGTTFASFPRYRVAEKWWRRTKKNWRTRSDAAGTRSDASQYKEWCPHWSLSLPAGEKSKTTLVTGWWLVGPIPIKPTSIPISSDYDTNFGPQTICRQVAALAAGRANTDFDRLLFQFQPATIPVLSDYHTVFEAQTISR